MDSSHRMPWLGKPVCRHAGSPRGGCTRAALALFVAAVLSGCAASGSNPYPYFERLAIEALPPAPGSDEDIVGSVGELAAAGAAAGGMGALASGLVASLACGPYFAVCFAGTGAAALGGATIGAVMAGSTALSAEDTERVVSYLRGLQRTRNLSEELAAALSARLPAGRLAAPGTADARLGLEAQPVRVASGLGDTVALWVAVSARLEWDLARPEPRQTSRDFACQSEPLSLDELLNPEETYAEQGISACVDDLAMQIRTALQQPGTGPDTDSVSPAGFGQYDPATGEW